MKRKSPLSFAVVDLPPAGIVLAGELDFQDFDIAPDGLFSFPEPVRFDLTVCPVGDGILVRGSMRSVVTRVCDRCLAPCRLDVSTAEVCHHLEHVLRTTVDLTEPLREDILMAFPSTCLCRNTCRGLCPQCGQDLNVATCACTPPVPEAEAEDDGIWQQLDGLKLRRRR